MSNHYYTPDDSAYYVKPSRLNRKRRRGWQSPEVERAIAEWMAEAQQNDATEKSNG